MSKFDASTYFAARAPRYQQALRFFPGARVLDFLPYFAGFRAGGVNELDNCLACDAFGGTGFLARGFARLGVRLVVADVCTEMLAGVAGDRNVETHVTLDDFMSITATYGKRAFDLVFSHGGLHHVVEGSAGDPDASGSRARQGRIVERLAHLLKPRGILVIADIPVTAPEERPGALAEQLLDLRLINACSPGIGEHLPSILGVSPRGGWTLEDVRQRVSSRLWKPVAFDVPRRFFDDFIAPNAPMGHVAVYPDFDDLDTVIAGVGLRPLGRINYRGPWLFSRASEAGWFFREKFSLHRPAPLGEDLVTELSVHAVLERYLGVLAAPACTAVNWGITYAFYQAA